MRYCAAASTRFHLGLTDSLVGLKALLWDVFDFTEQKKREQEQHVLVGRLIFQSGLRLVDGAI